MPAIGCSQWSRPSGTGRLTSPNATRLVQYLVKNLVSQCWHAPEVTRFDGSRPACGVGSDNPVRSLRRAGYEGQHGWPLCRPCRRSPFSPELALPSKLRITRDNVRPLCISRPPRAPGVREPSACSRGACRRESPDALECKCSARSLARRRVQGDRRESGGLRPSTTGGPLALDKFSDWVLAVRGVGGAQCASAHENRSADEPRLRAGGWLARRRGGSRALGCLTSLR
jgi:hypothetical protein